MLINPAKDKIRIGIDLPVQSIEVPYLQNPQVKGWLETSLGKDTWRIIRKGQDLVRFELQHMTADMIGLTLDAMRAELRNTPSNSRDYIVYRLQAELKRARHSRKGHVFLCE